MNPFTGVMLAGFFFVFLPIGIPTLVVCVVDILWAVPAALISAREAEKYGYDPGAYAKKGAIYSLLNFTLWRSLMKVMHGEKFEIGDVKSGYITLFVCWFVTAPFASLIYALGSLGNYDGAWGRVMLIWVVVSLYVWCTSIWNLREFHKKRVSDSVQESDDATIEVASDVSIPRGYLLPFLLAKLSILVTVALAAYDWYN